MANAEFTRLEFARIRRMLRDHLRELRERYGVDSLGIFGSFVRGDQRAGSDLDLLVEFDEQPLTLLQFIGLENYLSTILGLKVDLVKKDALKLAIKLNLARL